MKTEAPLIDRVAEFAIKTPASSFSADAISKAKVFLSDTIACAFAGSDCAHHRAMVVAFSVNGGTYHAPGRTEQLIRDDAAVLTAHAIHCLEWDAVHEPAVTHAMSVTTGALYADAQNSAALSGRDFIEAVIVGVDIASRLGVAASSGLRFFRPATAGLIGATAAIARLRGLSTDITKQALGLAYSQVQGTMQAHLEGTPTLAVQVALSARAALNACDMATAGMTAPQDIFDGPYGYFNLIEDGGDFSRALESLGEEFAIADLSIKPYPSGRASHGILSSLFKHIEAGTITPENFAGLTAYVPPLVHRLVGRPAMPIMTTAYARLCAPYLVGLALRDKRIDPRCFTEADFADDFIQAAACKVEIVIDDNPDQNALAPQRVDIHLNNGETIINEMPAVLGAPENPVSTEMLKDKFNFAASIAAAPIEPEQAHKIQALFSTLDTIDNLDTMFESITHT